MTFLDGLASFSQVAAYSPEGLASLRSKATTELLRLAPMDGFGQSGGSSSAEEVQLGPFVVARGPRPLDIDSFNLQVPTTLQNAVRVFRACQLRKPTLLEGSPGVGKTTLIQALANISGYHLCRINLSDQTDLMDLFGSDLPVEGGKPGEFAWKDAEFLRALQEGHWVLLDEMNLAPQAVLEGLNAVLDHRGSVYIPELGRTFTRHPSFRIFAAQNPLQQGGGRKGLPKSFLNRFNKVYVNELPPSDLLIVVRHLFPEFPEHVLNGMIEYNTQLNQQVAVLRSFGKIGSPWEFNLRDVIRWASLLKVHGNLLHPGERLWPIYLSRFRTPEDQRHAQDLFASIFSDVTSNIDLLPHVTITDQHFAVGSTWMARKSSGTFDQPIVVLQAHARATEAACLALAQSWLLILAGAERTGKKTLVEALAQTTGNVLLRISINSSTDTADILGGFEQSSAADRLRALLRQILKFFDTTVGTTTSNQLPAGSEHYQRVHRYLIHDDHQCAREEILGYALELLSVLPTSEERDQLLSQANTFQREGATQTAQFEWIDGALVRALRYGYWILLDNANLCNPSVLDRLNSLCEPGGTLVLNERGHVDGAVQVLQPHPNFRLFMTLDPRHGELSRAMRNRGVEVFLKSSSTSEDSKRLADHMRVISEDDDGHLAHADILDYDRNCRGLVDQDSCSLISDSTQRSPASLSTTSLLANDEQSQILASLYPTLLGSHHGNSRNDAWHYFATSILPSAHFPALQRLSKLFRLPSARFLGEWRQFASTSAILGVHEGHGHQWGVPSILLQSQVSTDHFQLTFPRIFFVYHVLNEINTLAFGSISTTSDAAHVCPQRSLLRP